MAFDLHVQTGSKQGSADRLAKQYGCKVCKLNTSKSEKTDYDGGSAPQVYIVGAFPTAMDLKQKFIFADDYGEYARDVAHKIFRKESQVRYGYLARCFDPRVSGTLTEIQCCESQLMADIEASKPKVVVGLGEIVLKAFLPRYSDIEIWRGKRVSCKVGNHKFWFIPTFDPKFILSRRSNNYPDKETQYDDVFRRDLKLAQSLCDESPIYLTKNFDKNLTLIGGLKSGDMKQLERHLADFGKVKVGLDLETIGLNPRAPEGKIISCAIGNYDNTVVFPIEHPQAWQGNYTGIKGLFKEFLLHSGRKVAHNMLFDLSWLYHYFGLDVVWGTQWGDTMMQAYLLDERTSKEVRGEQNETRRVKDVLSLDCLCRVNFGFHLKELSKDVDTRHLLMSPLQSILIYNGMDTKYTDLLDDAQMVRIEEEGLAKVYEHIIRVCKVLVVAKSRGVYFNRKTYDELLERYTAEHKKAEKAIYQSEEVNEFKRLYGYDYKISDRKDNELMFDKVLGLSEEDVTSLDKSVMKKFVEKGSKIAANILEFRALDKALTTYLTPMPSYVEADGRIHADFHPALTRTGRLSSSNPNMQNFPKRGKTVEVRNYLAAPKGSWLVSCDYGQIEARVIAMASKDPVWVRMVTEGYDVHMEWAKKILKKFPEAIPGLKHVEEATKDQLKFYRGEAKNKLVFPWFFGSSKFSVARNMKLPEDLASDLFDEFWSIFKGVKKWQQDLNEEYQETGYVRFLSGRKRRAPMSWNEIINCGIQGTSSDIVTDSEVRLAQYAWETDQPWYNIVLNVHDDNSFEIPDRKLDDALPIIAEYMVKTPFDFVNVPLAVEISVGRAWGSMKEVVTYTTQDFA